MHVHGKITLYMGLATIQGLGVCSRYHQVRIYKDAIVPGTPARERAPRLRTSFTIKCNLQLATIHCFWYLWEVLHLLYIFTDMCYIFNSTVAVSQTHYGNSSHGSI